MVIPPPTRPEVTVAVIGICGAEHIERCLGALARQRQAPPFSIVVVSDPRLGALAELVAAHPHVRFVRHRDQRTPLDLASRAMREASGEIVLLTEDHCVPPADWVSRLASAVTPGRGAVGGGVETDSRTDAVSWAFYYVDFFRYQGVRHEGPAPSLTVCNAAYRRDQLEAIRPVWEGSFHETVVHEALRRRFGALWLLGDAPVRMQRTVRFRDAVRERYSFGRLFGCTRLDDLAADRRLFYALLAPGLPALLLGRMVVRAARRRETARAFLRSSPVLVALVVAWSWGEWLGYLTRRQPKALFVAPELAQ